MSCFRRSGTLGGRGGGWINGLVVMDFDENFAVVFCIHVDLENFVVVVYMFYIMIFWYGTESTTAGRLYNQASIEVPKSMQRINWLCVCAKFFYKLAIPVCLGVVFISDISFLTCTSFFLLHYSCESEPC